MATATNRLTVFLDPTRLYTIRGFHIESGVSPTRVREAKRLGVALPCFEVGKRKFIRGRDAIDYIERLSAL
jgi:hypothetical protein